MRRAIRMLTTLVLVPGAVLAADRVDIDGTQILGNRELPKVVTIVPWQAPLPTDLVGRPATSLLDEVLAPVDREVFRRQVDYHALMQGAFDPTAGSPSSGPAR